MKERLPIVALIGQTNAGKSSLLNRFARQKIAIVAREEGTTRDSVSAKINEEFMLIDTAGLKDPNDDFEASIQEQINDAIDTADLILFVVDSTKYFDHKDKEIAKKALRSQKPVFLILNKSDLKESLSIEEFRALGIKPEDIFYTSATTGKGIEELKDKIKTSLSIRKTNKKELPEDDESTLKLAFIGRPNVGKSSLFNSLAKKQQAIVANLSGTTRDINRAEIRYKGKSIELLDTAGLRRQGKREVGIEKFSALRTLAAIEESDICCLLVDSTEPHAKLDQTLAGQIVKAGKGIIIVVTKSDLNDQENDELLNQLEYDFNFVPYAPVIITSSETGKNVTKIFEIANQIQENRKRELKTSDLNKLLADAVKSHPPAGLKNTHPKLRYMVQT
ncbi:ribosome biogenesis GTPase Der, partial [Candidatus Saccharibacteria bacterium]|nr:ribosome biogenesis GTPase Der [Candidatus Saccharibacteria bacterium]